jgi:hypothetical protein
VTSGDRQWRWAAHSRFDGEDAGGRFIVAQGEDALQSRIHLEIERLWPRLHREDDPVGQYLEQPFGPFNGKATLADCLLVFLHAREVWGVSLDRALLELARVPAFASFLDEAPYCQGLGISDLQAFEPQPRELCSAETSGELRRRVVETLGLPEETA